MEGAEASRPTGESASPSAAPATSAYPAWEWLVAGMVMFLISVPVASGVVLTTGTPPAWATFLSFLGIAYWGFLRGLTPALGGAGLGALILLLVWPLFAMLAALILERMEKKRLAGILAITTGVLFLPSGVLNVLAGLAYFREAKAQAVADAPPAKETKPPSAPEMAEQAHPSPRPVPDMLVGLRAASIDLFDRRGMEESILGVIRVARQILEESPEMFGVLLANGVRDPGSLGHAARAARDEFETLHLDYHVRPTLASARVSARIFAAIAYEQPFFDGNKRTGLLGGTLAAAMLGFGLRDSGYTEIEEEVRQLSARNASVEEVAEWLLAKVLIPPKGEEPR